MSPESLASLPSPLPSLLSDPDSLVAESPLLLEPASLDPEFPSSELSDPESIAPESVESLPLDPESACPELVDSVPLDPESVEPELLVSVPLVSELVESVPLDSDPEDSVPAESVPVEPVPVESDPASEFVPPVTLKAVSLVKLPTEVEEAALGTSPQALGIKFGSCSPVSGLIPTCCSSVGELSPLLPSAMS